MTGVPTSPQVPSIHQLAVGLLVWTDGWDTFAGCKSNPSPMHIRTVALLFVDIVVGMATYPSMGGPGVEGNSIPLNR
jgi:uncharacterized protein YqgC (DUF456 family)